ncbi:MAG: hypothetical protein GY765_02875 [bacterium]|nr:hypothetical protein [bacterium]
MSRHKIGDKGKLLKTKKQKGDLKEFAGLDEAGIKKWSKENSGDFEKLAWFFWASLQD